MAGIVLLGACRKRYFGTNCGMFLQRFFWGLAKDERLACIVAVLR